MKTFKVKDENKFYRFWRGLLGCILVISWLYMIAGATYEAGTQPLYEVRSVHSINLN